MRYAGQGYEISVALQRSLIATADRTRIRGAFEAEYLRLFGRNEPDMQVEIVSWRLTAGGPRPHMDLASARVDGARESGVPGRRRAVYEERQRGYVDTPVIDRHALAPGQVVPGPLVVEERESRVIVPRGASVRRDQNANLIIDLPAPD